MCIGGVMISTINAFSCKISQVRVVYSETNQLTKNYDENSIAFKNQGRQWINAVAIKYYGLLRCNLYNNLSLYYPVLTKITGN